MSVLSRIGVAIDSSLLKKFDSLIASRGYTNRSEAFRDLIRDELVEKTWESPEASVVGTVTRCCLSGTSALAPERKTRR